MRLAMWSGPRSISTALMRSWGGRRDTVVTDEPLYAHYLEATGLDHPGRDEVLASQERSWQRVVAWLTGPNPDGRPIWYQKHMAHHLLPGMGRDWLDALTNVVLIRDPRHVLPSLARVLPRVGVADTGIIQQTELVERARRGGVPLVVDADDVLADPRATLEALCQAVGAPFDRAMLAWEAGSRASDGVWGKHWYAAVEASTGFGPPRSSPEALPEGLDDVLDACMDRYRELHSLRLTG